jgi:hypothetical protein
MEVIMTADAYVKMILDPKQTDEDVAEAFFEIDLDGMSEARKRDALTLAIDTLKQHRPAAFGMIPADALRGLFRKHDD